MEIRNNTCQQVKFSPPKVYDTRLNKIINLSAKKSSAKLIFFYRKNFFCTHLFFRSVLMMLIPSEKFICNSDPVVLGVVCEGSLTRPKDIHGLHDYIDYIG